MPNENPCELEIPNDFLHAKEVEDRIVEQAAHCGFSEEQTFAIRLCLEEALSNAIRHGNGGDPTKKIRICYAVSNEKTEITIADQGTGFNPTAVPDPTVRENLETPSGRGIMLMKAYMNSVEYNKLGNQVRLVKLNKAG